MEFGSLNNKQIIQVLELSKFSYVSENYVMLSFDDLQKVFKTRFFSLRLLEHMKSVGLEYLEEKGSFIILKRIKQEK